MLDYRTHALFSVPELPQLTPPNFRVGQAEA